MSKTDTATEPICGVAGCRAAADVRIRLADGRARVVCLSHITRDSEVRENV